MFDWKHRQNAFGESPAWVAADGDRIVAFRTFMRWRFRWMGEQVSAVRAVDTVTHPDYRGRGLFRALTELAVDELTAEGVGFVFNTPNDQSRPGYLKMGWQVVGRLPIAARPRGAVGMARMLSARQPAKIWSDRLDLGDPIDAAVDGWVTPPETGRGLATDVSDEFLRWRYGFGPLHYRVVSASGARIVVRVRSRGAAREMALLQALDGRMPPVRSLLSAAGADYAVGLGASRPRRGIQLPGQGPLLTWRALARRDMPPLSDWRLSLGDIELF
jgi:GNAT superfamily N-acetyltransferase